LRFFCFSNHQTIKDGRQLKQQDLSYNAAVCFFDSFFDSFFRQGGGALKKGVVIREMLPDEIGEIDQLKRIADASENLVKIGWVISVLFIALLVILLSLIFL
jgi:hypothetical protein